MKSAGIGRVGHDTRNLGDMLQTLRIQSTQGFQGNEVAQPVLSQVSDLEVWAEEQHYQYILLCGVVGGNPLG